MSQALTRSNSGARGNFKRLVICCDGTWLDAAAPGDDGTLVPASNVTRLTRAVRPESRDGIPQIVYYQAGIGSTGSVGTKVVGGLTGAGLAENVREAYSFICLNWEDGDEIFLIGFSRGAFTARSVGGLIGAIGIMAKEYLEFFPTVYKDYAHRSDRSYRSPQPDIPYRNKPPFRDPEYVREMEREHMTTMRVRIRAIGVFDTVGSLGIPKVGWLGRLSNITIKDHNEYAFYDTTLDECVDNAFQALALDEKRSPFQPTLWEKRRNKNTNLIQVWFPGVHGNVGGGYLDQNLANITIAWMMSMLAPMLEIDLDSVLEFGEKNKAYYDKHNMRRRPWSFGKIYNSVQGYFTLGGTSTRRPGDYYRADPRTGEPTNKPLVNTREYVHSCVRTRFDLRGPGYNDKGDYDPKALRPYELRGRSGASGMPSPWYWERDDGLILPEAPLRKVEKMLLGMYPKMEEVVFEEPPPPPPSRRKSRR